MPQLSTDYEYSAIDVTVVFTCTNKFNGKRVRAVGQWNNWTVVEEVNLMNFDTNTCKYVLSVSGLKQNFIYEWKVDLIINYFAIIYLHFFLLKLLRN